MSNVACEKRFYLAELMKRYKISLNNERINLVPAPCGSGKTTWALGDLLKMKTRYTDRSCILYITDTTMLKEFMANKYKDRVKVFHKDTFKNARDYDLLTKGKEGRCKIAVMTYSTLGWLLSKDPCKTIIKKYFTLMICDEFHNLFYYYERYDKDSPKEEKPYKKVIDTLPSLIGDVDIVALTATPWKVSQYYSLAAEDILGTKVKQLRSYSDKIVSDFLYFENEIKLWRREAKGDFKILVYTKFITKAKEYKEKLNNIGFKTECLWSNKSKKHKLSKDQEELREYIIKNYKMPDDLRVLIINGAYETGWDLKDESVECVFVDSNHFDTIVQVRNRVRKDIILLKHKKYKKDLEELEYQSFNYELEPKYLGVELTKELRNEIIERYGLRQKDGNLSWQTMKKDLKRNGYIVKLNNKRKQIIYIEEDLVDVGNKKEENYINMVDYLDNLLNKKLMKEEQKELIMALNFKRNRKLVKTFSKINEELNNLHIPYFIESGKSGSIRYWKVKK